MWSCSRSVAAAALVASCLGGCKARTGNQAEVKGLVGASAAQNGQLFLLFADDSRANICLTYCDAAVFAEIAKLGAPPQATNAHHYCRTATACQTTAQFYPFWRALKMTDSQSKAALLGNVFENTFTIRLPQMAGAEAAAETAALAPQLPAIEGFYATAASRGSLTLVQENQLLLKMNEVYKLNPFVVADDPRTAAAAQQWPDLAPKLAGRYFWSLKPGMYQRIGGNPAYFIQLQAQLDAGMTGKLQTVTGDFSGEAPADAARTFTCDATQSYQPEDMLSHCKYKSESEDYAYFYDLQVLSQTDFVVERSRYEKGYHGADAQNSSAYVRYHLVAPSLDDLAAGEPQYFCNLGMGVTDAWAGGRQMDPGRVGSLVRDFSKFVALGSEVTTFMGSPMPDPKGAMIAGCEACLLGASRLLKLYMPTATWAAAQAVEFTCAEPVCYRAPGPTMSVPLAGAGSPSTVWYAERDSGFADRNFFANFYRRCSNDLVSAKTWDHSGPTWKVTTSDGLQFSKRWASDR